MKNTQKFREGDFIKAVGGDFGIYFDGSKWVSYQCHGCAIALGLIVPTQRIPLVNVSDKLQKMVGYNFSVKHSNEIHNAWFKAGKPYRK